MFRGKESSNRIELSRLVQDLLNFGVLGSLWLWGWGAGWMGVGGGLGVPPTHVHMHAHACTHTRTCMRGKHDNSMQMDAPIGFGEIPGIPYDVIHACMCVRVCACTCMCMCVGGPCHHSLPPSTHPPTSRVGDPQNQSKFDST